jgi:glycosyltransferase involved in cell wall biosynthesis
MQPEVSVIVPVRNGGADLRGLLESLRVQTIGIDRFEVVVGDDGSTDGSADGLDDGTWVRVVPGPPLNSYAARNRAVRASTGRVLAFCDADCRPEPEWLVEGLRALAAMDVAAGRIRFIPPEGRTIWSLIDADGTKDHARQIANDTAETANLFLLRELYDRVGGFDDSISEHGDFDFVERCVESGARLDYAAAAVVWHPVRLRARPLLRSVWIYNRGYAERAARDGKLPEGLRARAWIPILPVLRARRRWGLSIGPDRNWLRENDLEPTLRETILALPIMYLLIPYLRGFAQLSGWRDGRRGRAASR